MEYMLRAPDLEKILSLNERFDKVVMYAAKAAECEAVIENIHGYMPLYDDVELGKVMRECVEIVNPGAEFECQRFAASCTDMGDVAMVVPAVHGYVCGGGGVSHGIDYHIADPEKAYIENSILNAVIAVELLADDAAIGKKIAERKKSMMSIPEYIRVIDSLSNTLHSTDL